MIRRRLIRASLVELVDETQQWSCGPVEDEKYSSHCVNCEVIFRILYLLGTLKMHFVH